MRFLKKMGIVGEGRGGEGEEKTCEKREKVPKIRFPTILSVFFHRLLKCIHAFFGKKAQQGEANVMCLFFFKLLNILYAIYIYIFVII